LHEISQQRQHQLDESGQSDLQREKSSPELLLHVTAHSAAPAHSIFPDHRCEAAVCRVCLPF
jgi:hypothetical protein